MATIVAACVAVTAAAAKASSDKKAANQASAQAMATHQANQSAQIARAYSSSMRATSGDSAAKFDAARAGDTGGGDTGTRAA